MNTTLSRLGLLIAGIFLASQANADNYTLRILGAGTNSAPSINLGGQVASGATLWNGTTRTDLASLGGKDSYSRAINNAGQVVGYSSIDQSDSSATHATLWNGARATDLGTLGGGNSNAKGINNAGQVVGDAETSDAQGGATHAFLSDGVHMRDLGALPGATNSYASGINDKGQVVGTSNSVDGGNHAVIWNGTTMSDLGLANGTPSWYSSSGFGINNAGQVVGSSETGQWHRDQNVEHAMLWSGTTKTELGTLGGDNSVAYSINNSGLVVGWANQDNNAMSAVMWKNGQAINLNSLTNDSDWHLYMATGINDQGAIVGLAMNGRSETRSFVLSVSAVPEPESYAMLLAGLGLLGFMSRRKKGAA
ncbi:putative HAF family extracellular repeat protein [Oxalobacteraceae bacterium GrIS 1.11]